MEVLEDDDRGHLDAEPAERVHEVVEREFSSHLQALTVLLADVRGEAEEPAERRWEVGCTCVELRQPRGELLPDRVGVVVVGDLEPSREEVADEAERTLDRVRNAASLEPPHPNRRLGLDPIAVLVEQARLADSRLSDHEHYLPVAAFGFFKALRKKLQFALPPNEGCQPALCLYLQSGSSHTARDHVPGLDRFGFPFERQLPQGPSVEVVRDQTMGHLRDHNASGIRSLLKPSGHVGRIAESGVIHAKIAPNTAHDDKARVDPLSNIEIDSSSLLKFLPIRSQSSADPQSRVNGPLRVILMGNWSAKKCHDAVAKKLGHRSFVAVHLAQHQVNGPIH